MARELTIQVTADTDDAQRKMRDMEQALRTVGVAAEDIDKKMSKEFGAEWNSGLKKSSGLLGEVNAGIGSLAANLGGPGAAAGMAGALGYAAKQALNYADSIQTLSKQSRMGTDAVQTLGFVADKNGSSFQAVANAVNTLDQRLASAMPRTVKAVNSLGMSVDELLSMKPEERFRAIGSAIGNTVDPSERAEVALALFGTAGKDLLATFDSLADGAEKNAPRMSKAWVEANAESKEALDSFYDSLMNLARWFLTWPVVISKAAQDMGLTMREAFGWSAVSGLPNAPGSPKNPFAPGPGGLAQDPFSAGAFNGQSLNWVLDQLKPEKPGKVLPFVRPELMGETDYMNWLLQARGPMVSPISGMGPGSFPGWANVPGFSLQQGGQRQQELENWAMANGAMFPGSVQMSRPNIQSTPWLQGAGGRFLGAGLGMATNFLPGLSREGSGIGSSFGGALGGLKGVTSALGSFAPFLGPIMGIAGGLIGKLFGDSEKDKTNKARGSFLEEMGGRGSLQSTADKVGFDTTNLFNAKKVKDFEAEVKKLEQAMEAYDQKVQETQSSLDAMNAEMGSLVEKGKALGFEFDKSGELVKVDFKAMQEAAQRYGIDLNSLGPAFQQQRISEAAQTIIDDFELLSRGGADVGGVLQGMSGQISALVQDSLKFGTTIPANMRPWIVNLMETGQLTDENGQAITDLSQIKFGEPIQTQFEGIQTAIKDLIVQIAEMVGKMGELMADRTIHVGVVYDDPGPPDGFANGTLTPARGGMVLGHGAMQYFDRGGFVPKGTDTVPAMLTPGEMVLRRDSVARLVRGDWPSAGLTVTIGDVTVGVTSQSEAELADDVGKALIRGLKIRGAKFKRVA
jgi:hypothetical protein